MSSYINTWLSTGSAGWNFSQMNSDMKNVVKDILLNSDWVSQLPSDINSGDWDEVSNWLEQEFPFAINNIDDEEIQAALVDAFNGDFTIEALQEVINQLLQTEGFDENNPLIIYLRSKIDDKKALINGVKAKLKAGEDQYISQLSNEDLEIASEKIAVDDETLLTWDELIAKIEEYKTAFDDFPDASDSPSTLSDILSSSLPDSETTYNDAINDFKSTVGTINSSLENAASLDASDLIELIQQFSDFDWASYGVTGEKGIGDISGALEALKQQELSNIISSLEKLKSTVSDDSTTQWIDHLIASLKEISVYTEEAEQLNDILDNTQSTLSTYYDYIEKIKSGNFSGTDLLDAYQLDGFKEAYAATGDLEQALRSLIDNELSDTNEWLRTNADEGYQYSAMLKQIAQDDEFAAKGISSVSDAFSAMQDTYNTINTVNNEIAESGTISVSTLNDIMSKYPSMVDTVQQYMLNGTLENMNAVITGLQNCYQTDFDNYCSYLKYKMQVDGDFYTNNVLKHVKPYIEKLANVYGTDLSNYKSFIEAKEAMDAEYYSHLAEAKNSEYKEYQRLANEYGEKAKNINPGSINNAADANTYSNAQKYAKLAEETRTEYLETLKTAKDMKRSAMNFKEPMMPQ